MELTLCPVYSFELLQAKKILYAYVQPLGAGSVQSQSHILSTCRLPSAVPDSVRTKERAQPLPMPVLPEGGLRSLLMTLTVPC